MQWGVRVVGLVLFHHDLSPGEYCHRQFFCGCVHACVHACLWVYDIVCVECFYVCVCMCVCI